DGRRGVERFALLRGRAREVVRGGTGRLRLPRGCRRRRRGLFDGSRFVVQLLDQRREGLEGRVAADAFRDGFELCLGDLLTFVRDGHVLLCDADGVGGCPRVV